MFPYPDRIKNPLFPPSSTLILTFSGNTAATRAVNLDKEDFYEGVMYSGTKLIEYTVQLPPPDAITKGALDRIDAEEGDEALWDKSAPIQDLMDAANARFDHLFYSIPLIINQENQNRTRRGIVGTADSILMLALLFAGSPPQEYEPNYLTGHFVPPRPYEARLPPQYESNPLATFYQDKIYYALNTLTQRNELRFILNTTMMEYVDVMEDILHGLEKDPFNELIAHGAWKTNVARTHFNDTEFFDVNKKLEFRVKQFKIQRDGYKLVMKVEVPDIRETENVLIAPWDGLVHVDDICYGIVTQPPLLAIIPPGNLNNSQIEVSQIIQPRNCFRTEKIYCNKEKIQNPEELIKHVDCDTNAINARNDTALEAVQQVLKNKYPGISEFGKALIEAMGPAISKIIEGPLPGTNRMRG